MIKVIYNKVCGRCVQSEPLTSGMVGQPIELEYSPDFDGLTLTAVFTNGKTTVDVLNPGNQCVIPHEVLGTVGTLVKVGIYAVRGNELVIPTVYATIGVVQKGADPSGDVSIDPTLPVWAQIQGVIGNLNDLSTEAKNNLVAAINEAAQSGGGGGSSTVELDTTLTQSGQAADAKAVGDALAGKQDKLIAGENITIAADGKTISATGGGVQSDWNQNDSTAADYVKNRPFYTGNPVETVLVEESTVSFADAGGLYQGQFLTTFEATVGETYAVNWDGTEYECVCSVFNSVPVLGNLSIAGAGSDTGEPFVMLVSNGKGLRIFTLDTSASHAFSISGFIAQNVQIPDKYISDTFRDVIIAGNPLKWSAADWTKHYGLFQGGKLLKINSYIGSDFEGYVLSMFYASGVGSQISVITPTGEFYKLSFNNTTSKLYWAPVFQLNKLYFNYLQTGSDPNLTNREEYQRLEISDGLTFTTKTSAEDPVQRKVVLEGDKELILSSSTTGSTKQFKITVDDSGTITATEIV